MKRGIFAIVFLVLTLLGGLYFNQKYKNYEHVTANEIGLELQVPKGWDFIEDSKERLVYGFPVDGEEENGIFYVLSYPKDSYNSHYMNDDHTMYKNAFKLKEKEQLDKNKQLLFFTARPDGWKDNILPTKEICIIIVELRDRVLEISFDMPKGYYDNNADMIQLIQKSVASID